MNQYELVVLLHPDLEIDIDTPVAKIEKLIESLGGRIIKRDNWGKKRLAYRVRKVDFAVYVYLEIELDGQQIRSLESTLLITEEVLRHLIVSRLPENPVAKPARAKVATGATTNEEETV